MTFKGWAARVGTGEGGGGPNSTASDYYDLISCEMSNITEKKLLKFVNGKLLGPLTVTILCLSNLAYTFLNATKGASNTNYP